MYQVRKAEFLRMYTTISASVSKNLLQRYKLPQEQSDNFVLTPTSQLQVHIIVKAHYLHRRTRGAFWTIAVANELEEID